MDASEQQMSLGESIKDSAPDQSLDAFFEGQQLDDLFSGDESAFTFDTEGTITPIDLSDADMSQFDGFFPPAPAVPEEVIPMEPPMPQPLPTGPPGACFHPAVGWYFPAQPQSYQASYISGAHSYVATQFTQQTVPMLGFAQPQNAGILDRVGIPSHQRTPFVQKPWSKKRKQCFGPSSYFRGDLSTADESSASGYNSETTEQQQDRIKRAKVTSAPRPRFAAPGMDKGVVAAFHAARYGKGHRLGKPPSIIQRCTCTTPETKIPRPKNAFIIFRMHKALEYRSRLGPQNHQKFSKLAAEEWHRAPQSVRAKFYQMADAEKQKHAELYPGYKYAPKGSKLGDFGTADCTCGAYNANMARWKRDFETGKRCAVSDDSEDEEQHEALDDGHVPAIRSSMPQQRFQAPTAQMTVPQSFPDQMPDFGLPPSQQVEAAAAYANMKAQQNAARDVPTPTTLVRRSVRNKQPITYTEPSDHLLDEDFGEVELFPTLATNTGKRRPSPISTTRANNTADPLLSTPAQNTRSKTKTPSPALFLPAHPEDVDLDITEFFADADEIAGLTDLDEELDEIAGAGRPSSRKGGNGALARSDPRGRTRSSVSR